MLHPGTYVNVDCRAFRSLSKARATRLCCESVRKSKNTEYSFFCKGHTIFLSVLQKPVTCRRDSFPTKNEEKNTPQCFFLYYTTALLVLRPHLFSTCSSLVFDREGSDLPLHTSLPSMPPLVCLSPLSVLWRLFFCVFRGDQVIPLFYHSCRWSRLPIACCFSESSNPSS